MKKFEKQIEVRWADVDANMHVRHSAYYEYGADARISFFATCGFGSTEMKESNIGPILFKEECSFIKELHPDDNILINVLRGEISEDGSRWELHHEILNNGVKSAHITAKGAWMDLSLRKLATPPVDMSQVLNQLPVGEQYVYKKSKK